ncbi:Cobalamin synthase [Nitrospira japonica]|uniref:Adenosylcobinamide-GDP ribazoletransferase n=1 Tax=Nitrospira japonica TaxID=1325564 RepID=A0A1W1I9N4_9BACT|nr:adenosylcobinamide-GDP ribazoletransferase [Nitrospira japonica]SLM49700.1 Cobalamin synthase [Nitrospira japonica]
MTAGLRSPIIAWQFLTSVPLSRRHHEPSPAELAWSMVWYPFVGIILGAILAVTNVLLMQRLSRDVSAVLCVILLVALTRGLHQDGLADTLDGLAGGRTPADRLAIMKDPCIGALGATGLALSLVLRCTAVAALPDAARLPALLCMPVMGRWAMVVGAWGATHARAEGGLAAPFLAHLSWRQASGATILAAGSLSWAVGLYPAAVMLGVGAMASRLLTWSYRRAFGGITGDTLGTTNELVELCMLVLLPLLWQLP